MMFKRKTWGFIFVVLAVMIILSGCESGSSGDSADIVYNFAGSIGKGDFINLDINLSKGEYNYTNRITDDPTVNGTFEELGKNFYQLDSGDYFFLLEDEVLIATNKDGLNGEQIITALSEVNSEYGTEIQNTYNIITSLEGNWGTVEVKSDTVDIRLTGDGTNYEELLDKPYSFKNDFGAIEIIEDGSKFRHYGLFLNGEIGIFDSYWRDNPDIDPTWSGDGMSILVKQDDSVSLSDFEGTYNFVDVDGDIGSIKFENATSDSIVFSITVIENGKEETHPDNLFNGINKNSGLFTFNTDITGSGSSTYWSMMLVPGSKKVIVIGTKDPNVFEATENDGDENGGIFIGIEK